MFCWNCGAKNADNGKFCTECGAKLVSEAAAPVQSAPVQPAPVQTAPAAPAAAPKAAAPAAQKPVRRKKTGWIIGAVAAIVIAAIAAAVIFLVPMLRYNAAEKLMDDGKYTDAAAAFEALGDYRDAEEQVQKAGYLYACDLLDEGNYEEAAEAFESLDDYKDSEEQVREAMYLYARELLKDGDYDKAGEILEDLEGYGDYDVSDLIGTDQGVPAPAPDPIVGDSDESADTSETELAGTYDITMWVPEQYSVEQIHAQIDAFEAANPGIVINANIEGISAYDVGSKVAADVASAPDIYCFTQDQLARLVQAGALAAPGREASEFIRNSNDAGSVAAASVAGTLYAYPMTSDNGYYLYYDTSIIETPESLEAIIAGCEQSGKLFRFALENAWYTASFFFATGCHSNWIVNDEGYFTAVDDDFNSANGLIAMRGMEKLAKSSCYDSNADIFTDAGAIVTGIWNASAAAEHFGDNLGVTDLPSFEVDGKFYHLGSYTGNKLMGIKPQNDAKRAAVLSLLAQYLTGEECQLQRFVSFEWCPSNKNAQASYAVQSNASLAALIKQSEYGQPQGQIHGSWWDIAKVLGADARNATSEGDLQAALDNYTATIHGLFFMTEEQKNAWSVIGSVGGTMWDVDFPMTKQYDGVYLSEVMELEAGDEFKVRQGASWDMNFGVEYNGANIVVPADGLYQVQLVWNGGQDGTVTLIPVN